jgi:uncharacterized alpha/beta hydrolase family protein
MSYKKRMLICLIGILIMVLAACGDTNKVELIQGKSSQKPTSGSEKETDNKVVKDEKPVIFIHGYQGTVNSMGGMIRRLSKSTRNTHKSLVIHVSNDGTLTTTGTYEKGKINLIQLIFDNNRSGVYEQYDWIKKTMDSLNNMGITKIDVVAHSMGGESITYYMEHMPSGQLPAIERFIPIATPFTWNFGGPPDFTSTVDNLIKSNIMAQGKAKLPENLSVMAIAGVVESDEKGDGTVPLMSATFGKYIFKPENYKEEIIRGANARHSGLHENTEVDALVTKFLWGN